MNLQNCRAGFVAVAALVEIFVMLAAGTSRAADSCKVKVDKKTGLIVVSATNLSGIPGWRDVNDPGIGQVFHLPTCVVANDDILSCHLADPTTPEAKIPPPSCELCVEDGTGIDCCTRIKGCTPGARDCTTVSNQGFFSTGTYATLSAQCPSGYRVTGGGGSHVAANFMVPALQWSEPNVDGDAWNAGGWNGTGQTSTLTVHAVCCRLP